MSAYFPDIDAVCSSLGWLDGDTYTMDPEAVQSLKHLIWILKQDRPAHECRRYIGGKRIVQTDLIPMVISNFDKPDVVDVLLRLLVNLSFPTLLLYNGNYPKDAVEQRKFMRLIEICEEYKEAFSVKSFWSALGDRLEKILHTDWAVRSEADGLIIERILVLVRNVLQVPSNVEKEKRLDNDASQHDCLLWALHQAGILDIILYILGSPHENRYLIHALEIISLAYREQSAASLADATLQRSTIEKQNDEKALMKALKADDKQMARTARRTPAPGRHSWFRGTYTYNNLKSISESDAICHQSLNRLVREDFGAEKSRIKPSHRLAKETVTLERKSIFAVRLFLREYCMEILRLYNNIVHQTRRYLDQSGSSGTEFHDDSYLLWAIRFFLEFNRHSKFMIELVSESLSIDTFHWIIRRMETYIENITSDKTRKSVWARRLHLAVQTYRELLNNLHALEKNQDPKAKELLSMLQNNIFYVVEYRETAIHLLTNFKESNHTRAYLRDVVEVTHLFFSMLQKFCKGTMRVQQRVKPKRKKSSKKSQHGGSKTSAEAQEDAENLWLEAAPIVAALLENNDNNSLLKEDLPTPFDTASSEAIDEQKGYCAKRIHALLHEKQFEQAIKMMYAGRSVWTTDDCFGRENSTPDEDLIVLRDIFTANLSSTVDQTGNESDQQGSDDEEELEESEGLAHNMEQDFKFEDFSKRLVDHRVVHGCTIVLSDWEKIKTSCLKAAVTLLFRVCVEHKMPCMLFQVSLMRVFQNVLNAPQCDHSFELRRLAVYTVRQLQRKAMNSTGEEYGLLFAELLFYKSLRIATAIDMGYDEVFGSDGKTGASSKAWTEAQEEELRRLFMENQENPHTDQDVIDWLLDNLVDQTRTRRGVIKKLKDLGLIFRAPTKKSNANRQPKGQWTGEDDEKLAQLYNELRLEKHPLKSIAEAFGKKYTKPVITRRMVSLGLIADTSEVMPAARTKSSARSEARGSDNSSENDSDVSDEDLGNEMDQDIQDLDEKAVKRRLQILGSDMKEAVRWIIECLEEMLNMYDDSEPTADTEGGIPIVPIAAYQTAALEKTEFKDLLRSLSIMNVGKQHVYHRIPYNLSPMALKARIALLNDFCSGVNNETTLSENNGVDPVPERSDESSAELDDGSDSKISTRDGAVNLTTLQSDESSDERDDLTNNTNSSLQTTNATASSKRHRSDSSDSATESSLNQTKKGRRKFVISSDEE